MENLIPMIVALVALVIGLGVGVYLGTARRTQAFRTARQCGLLRQAVNSRMPCGSSVMPTPSSFSSGAASYTRHEMCRAFKFSASVSPQIPPPTMAMSMRVSYPLAPSSVEDGRVRPCGRERVPKKRSD